MLRMGFRGLRCSFGGSLESEDKHQYVHSMVLRTEREKGERKMESLAVLFLYNES